MNLFLNKVIFPWCRLLLIAGLFTVFSCDSAEKKAPVEKVKLTGRFTTVGNAPFIKLVFRTDSGESYEVEAQEVKNFIKLQGKKITIEAMAGTYTLETADRKIKKKFKRINKITISDISG